MRLAPISLLVLLAGCGTKRTEVASSTPITIFAAASLARPLAALAQASQTSTHVILKPELGGSLEHARKITDLGRVPDVLMLADDDVMAALAPTHLSWYVRFATNHIVVAYTSASRHAESVTADNWWRVLTMDDVSVGRADPAIAPAGRLALSIMKRAEMYYRQPGLGDRLIEHAQLRFMRPDATQLAALLDTHEVDYILDYESVARQYGFKYVTLPEDLAGAVLYGVSVPRSAQHSREAVAWVSWLLSEDGKRALSDAGMHVLRVPVAIGSNVPASITDIVRTVAAAR